MLTILGIIIGCILLFFLWPLILTIGLKLVFSAIKALIVGVILWWVFSLFYPIQFIIIFAILFVVFFFSSRK